MFAITNPFDLRGPDFLLIYGVLAVLALVGVFLLRRSVRNGGAWQPATPPALDPYEAAFLAGGGRRVLMLGLTAAIDDGMMKPAGDKLIITGVPDAKTHSVVRAMLSTAHVAPTVRDARESIRKQCETIHHALQTQGLLVSEAARQLYVAGTVLLMGGVIVFGLTKLGVGISRDRPIGILGFLSFVMFIATVLLIVRRPFRTRAGDAYLNRLQRELPADSSQGVYQHGVLPLGLATSGTAAMAVALWGMPALAGHPEYEQLKQTMGPINTAGTTSGGSSCSSGSCSSGDGGGGGGGCGGCGGGGD